jgi:hypothetical protein
VIVPSRAENGGGDTEQQARSRGASFHNPLIVRRSRYRFGSYVCQGVDELYGAVLARGRLCRHCGYVAG